MRRTKWAVFSILPSAFMRRMLGLFDCSPPVMGGGCGISGLFSAVIKKLTAIPPPT